MWRLTLLLIFPTIFVATLGHRLNLFSTCSVVKGDPDLNVDDILGKWYLIEVYEGKIIKGTNPCIAITFDRIDATSLNITQFRVFDPFNIKLVDSTITSTGILNIDDPAVSSKMTVKWPRNILGAAQFNIMLVQKGDYMAFYECKTVWGIASRDSAAILSKTPELSNEKLNSIKESLKQSGIDIKPFAKVDHNNCISKDESDLNFKLDGNSNLFDIFSNDEIKDIEQLESVKEFINIQNPEHSSPQEEII